MGKLKKWNKILLRLYIKDSGIYPIIRNFGWEPKLSAQPQQEAPSPCDENVDVPHCALCFRGFPIKPPDGSQISSLSGECLWSWNSFCFALRESSTAKFAQKLKAGGSSLEDPPDLWAWPHVPTQSSPRAETHPAQQTCFVFNLLKQNLLPVLVPGPTSPALWALL